MIKNGALGELSVMKYFLSHDFEVYNAVTDSTTYDLLLAKDKEIFKVEVKSTSARNDSDTGWIVQLKSVRSNKTVNKIKNFDNTSVDYLVVYIEPLDLVVVFDSTKVTQKVAMTLNDKELGSVAEWSIAPALKTGKGKPFVSPNLTASAKL